jgi:hypothetical protein
MTITLEHQRQWCAEAGANLDDHGFEHGVEWRIGPAPAAHSGTYADHKPVMTEPVTSCAVCGATFGTGQTIVRTTKKETWPWRCVKCFDWSVVTLEGTRSSRRPTGPGYSRQPTITAAAKSLIVAAQTAPRFKVTKPETFTTDKKLAPLVAAVIVASGTTVNESAPMQPTKKETTLMPRKPKPVTYMEVFTPKTNPADEMVAELVEAFKKTPEEAHAMVDEICVEESWPRPALIAPEPPPASPTRASLPEWAEEWLAGLVYEAKRDYARQYLEHILCGAPAPANPGAEWADKARKRADRLAEKAAA